MGVVLGVQTCCNDSHPKDFLSILLSILFLILELTGLAELACQGASGVLLCPLTQCRGYSITMLNIHIRLLLWVLRIRTQVLMLYNKHSPDRIISQLPD